MIMMTDANNCLFRSIAEQLFNLKVTAVTKYHPIISTETHSKLGSLPEICFKDGRKKAMKISALECV